MIDKQINAENEKTGDYYSQKITDAVIEFASSTIMPQSKATKIYHDKVREAVNGLLGIPFEKRSYELNMAIINGCQIIGDHTTALTTLIDIKEDGQDDPMWYQSMGLCFFGSAKIDKKVVSLKYFSKFMEYEEEVLQKMNGKDIIANIRSIVKGLTAKNIV
jgi:hypothetical protein